MNATVIVRQSRSIERIVSGRPTSDGDGVQITAQSESSVLLVAGKPLGEPIAQYRPFVMNNAEQVEQALQDYRAGRLA